MASLNFSFLLMMSWSHFLFSCREKAFPLNFTGAWAKAEGEGTLSFSRSGPWASEKSLTISSQEAFKVRKYSCSFGRLDSISLCHRICFPRKYFYFIFMFVTAVFSQDLFFFACCEPFRFLSLQNWRTNSHFRCYVCCHKISDPTYNYPGQLIPNNQVVSSKFLQKSMVFQIVCSAFRILFSLLGTSTFIFNLNHFKMKCQPSVVVVTRQAAIFVFPLQVSQASSLLLPLSHETKRPAWRWPQRL